MWDHKDINYMDSFSLSLQLKRFGQGYLDVSDVFSVHPTNDVFYHLITMFQSIVFFTFLFVITFFILEKILKPDFFIKKSITEKYEVIVLINANLHHLVFVSFGIFTLAFLCDKPFILLNVDAKCLRTYRPFYSQTAMAEIGYFIFDLVV